MENQMKCLYCNTELIWGGDNDIEENVKFILVTNFSCPKCESHVDVYKPKKESGFKMARWLEKLMKEDGND